MNKKITLSVTLLSSLSFFAKSQVSIPGNFLDRIDKTDSSALMLYTSIKSSSVVGSSYLKALNPTTKISFNSNYPRGYNDGPVWKGKGFTTELHFGVSGKKNNLSFTFFPTIFFSQNQSFDLAPHDSFSDVNPFNYEYGSKQIDWVQRYGPDPYIFIHPGQSEIKYQFGAFHTSISTQNYSLGPSTFNPIILSRQASGFPHFRFGSDPFALKIQDLSLGLFETNILFGLLSESDYYDNNQQNDSRYLNGLSIAYSPSLASGLTIGFSKMLYKDTRFFQPIDLLSTFYIKDNGVVKSDTVGRNDTFDQVASISLDWNFPAVGFRAYVEFAKNDFTGDARWTLLEPEHGRGYTLGFEKSTLLKSEKILSIIYEHTNISINSAFLWRPPPTFYVHTVNRQGYTHNGQMLGAGIGPGGNSDHFGIVLSEKDRKLGLLIQRVEANRDYFILNIRQIDLHDVEYSLGLFFQKETSKTILSLETTFSHNFNRYFLEDENNVYLGFTTKFKLFPQKK